MGLQSVMANLRQIKLLLLMLAGCAWLALSASADSATEWRMPMHDPQRSNFSPGVAHLTKPGVRWSVPLEAGASAVTLVDVDRDGRDDVVLVSGGRVTARSLGGKVLWQTPVLGAGSAFKVADLTGDNTPDVLAVSARSIVVLDAASGAIQFQTPGGTFKAITGVWVADFNGDGQPDLGAADNGSIIGGTVPTLRMWTWQGGKPVALGQTAIPTPDGKYKNALAQQVLDIDGDDVADALILDEELVAMSGKTGQILGVSAKLAHASPWPTAVVRVPASDGGAPYLVWAGNSAQLYGAQRQVGWMVLRRQGDQLQSVWLAEAATPLAEAVALDGSTIGDLDGDGATEILSSHFVGGAWRLEAADLQTGKALAVGQGTAFAPPPGSPGLVLRAGLQVAGQTVLLASEQPDRLDLPVPHLRLLKWSRQQGFSDFADLGSGVWWQGNRLAPSQPDDVWRDRVVRLRSVDTGQISNTGAELLIQRDSNGDLRIDGLERVRVAPAAAGGPAVVESLGTYPLSPGSRPVAMVKPGPLWLLTSNGEGRVAAWNTQQQLVNDSDGDGQPDLLQRIGSVVTLAVGDRSAAGDPVIAASLGARVAVLDPVGAGPAQPPKVLWSDSPTDQGARATLADTDGDGNREIVLRYRPADGNAVVQGRSLAGQPQWSWTWPDAPVSWALNPGDPWFAADLDGDGAEEVFLSVNPLVAGAAQVRQSTLLAGKSHLPTWTTPGVCWDAGNLMGGLDTSVQPPRLVRSSYHTRLSCNALTGALIAQYDAGAATYGTPMMVDLDGKPPLDFVLGTTALEDEADIGDTLQPLWHQPFVHPASGPSALATIAGQPVSLQMVPADAQLRARDAVTGKLLWDRIYVQGQAWLPGQAPPHSQTIFGLVTLADLTGEGQPAALFSSSEGLLYAVSLLDGAVLWVRDFGGVPGSPLPADVDGDGLLEVLIATPQGELVALDSNVATPPDWVHDHGPQGPALQPSDDIDEQEEATVFRCNWKQVADANGYLVRLVDDTGAEVLKQSATATDVTLTGLYLQPGRTYHAAVAAAASSGPDASLSTEVQSDGVQVVDKSPPWFENLRCEPDCKVPAGSAIALAGMARDKTRLGGVVARLDQPADGPVLQTWPTLTDAQDLALALPQLAVGTHDLTLRAVDLAGHVTTASLTLTVCEGACSPVAVAGSPVEVNGTRAQGCTAGRVGQPAALVFGLLLVMQMWRWSRKRKDIDG